MGNNAAGLLISSATCSFCSQAFICLFPQPCLTSFFVVTFQSSGSSQSIVGHDQQAVSLHLPKFPPLTMPVMFVLLGTSACSRQQNIGLVCCHRAECKGQAALEKRNMPCTYLTHHEQKCANSLAVVTGLSRCSCKAR